VPTQISSKFVGDKFGSKEFRYAKNFSTGNTCKGNALSAFVCRMGSSNTEQERERVCQIP
jgi:hypothetical protein